MKDFNYNQKQYDENLEALLKYRKKKINRQEIIFKIILAVIITMFLFYAVNKIRYTEFDGYITTEMINIKANDDMFITQMHKIPGNIVFPGDTLFSYIYMNHFMENLDKNKRPDIINRERETRMEYENTKNEISLLKVQIAEIDKQLAVEDHNIKFGISDNDRKMELQRRLVELQRRLVELRERLKGQQSAAVLLEKLSKELTRAAEITGYNVKSPAKFNDLLSFHNKRKISYTIHRLAHDTAFIADIAFYDNSMVFKKEEIIKLQPINAKSNKLYIRAYVPLDKVKYLSYKHSVEVIVDDDLSFKAHMAIMASRVVDLPDNLKSNFSNDSKVLLAVFHPDPMQDVPFWVITDGVPVKIRVRNFSKYFWNQNNNTNEHLIYRIKYGIPEESKERFREKIAGQ